MRGIRCTGMGHFAMARIHDHNYRNRRLLDAIRSLPCQFQIPDVCEGGDCSDPAHSNQQLHGKGKSLKAHDCFVAAGCRACHREIDQGMRLSREDRIYYWRTAYDRTMLLLWQRDLIEVKR